MSAMERDPLDALTATVRIELERSDESDIVAVSDYGISLILEAATPYLKAKALREAAGVLSRCHREPSLDFVGDVETNADYAAWLVLRADAMVRR